MSLIEARHNLELIKELDTDGFESHVGSLNSIKLCHLLANDTDGHLSIEHFEFLSTPKYALHEHFLSICREGVSSSLRRLLLRNLITSRQFSHMNYSVCVGIQCPTTKLPCYLLERFFTNNLIHETSLALNIKSLSYLFKMFKQLHHTPSDILIMHVLPKYISMRGLMSEIIKPVYRLWMEARPRKFEQLLRLYRMFLDSQPIFAIEVILEKGHEFLSSGEYRQRFLEAGMVLQRLSASRKKFFLISFYLESLVVVIQQQARLAPGQSWLWNDELIFTVRHYILDYFLENVYNFQLAEILREAQALIDHPKIKRTFTGTPFLNHHSCDFVLAEDSIIPWVNQLNTLIETYQTLQTRDNVIRELKIFGRQLFVNALKRFYCHQSRGRTFTNLTEVFNRFQYYIEFY